MKKRVKLLTTIASLCLAVALMAFGVYAANLSVTVSGSISYTATGVDGEWTWEAKITEGTATFANGEATVTSANFEEGDLAIVLGTNGDVTIEVTGTFVTTSVSDNAADLSITTVTENGVTIDDSATGQAAANAGTAGTVKATITYTAGDALSNQSASWSITFVAASAYKA